MELRFPAKLCFNLVLLVPVVLQAQIMAVPGLVEEPGEPDPSLLHQTITAMNASYTKGELDLAQDDFFWNGTRFLDSDDGGQFTTTFVPIDVPPGSIEAGSDLSIGYIGSEPGSGDKLSVSLRSVGRYQTVDLFDSETDLPPMSYTMARASGVRGKIWYDLLHNGVAHTQEGAPFRFWIESLNERTIGNRMFLAGDSLYLLGGTVGPASPIPEPAHIAVGAVMGLGMVLLLRRRFVSIHNSAV